jgi:hypothetical protein
MEQRERGTGTITQIGENRFRGRLPIGKDADGRIIRKSYYGGTYKEVDALIMADFYRMKAGETIVEEPEKRAPKAKKTVSDLMDEFLWTYRRGKVSDVYFESQYIHNKNHITPALGDIALTALTPLDVQQFVNDLKAKKGLAHKTIKETLATLKMALNYAIDPMEYIVKNPAN